VRGSWSEARSWHEDALAHPQAAGYAYARAVVLLDLGNMSGMQGDYTSAQAQLTDSLRLFQELGETPWSAWLLNRLGWLAREHDDVATARRRLEESIEL